MSPSQPKKGEPLTLGDRAVMAFLGGLFAFATMMLVWFLVMNAGGRRGQDLEMPFYWTYLVGGVGAAASFAAGPERTMDAFGAIWGVVGAVLFRRARDD